ncbi:MAG: ArnT family glycosyltransferase [Pirellulales bacterium]
MCALLLLFGALAWSAVRYKSTTYDEIAHITAGCSYWLYSDYRLQPENGVLPQRLEALPLVIGGVKFPAHDDPRWRASDVWTLGYPFFYELGNDFRQMLWRARGMVVLLGMVLGAVVYAWSRRLFGVAGGLISLALYVLCPSMLAHSALATSDVAATLMFVVALGCLWRGLHKVTLPNTVASGVALGLLAVAKMSAIVILPVVFLLFVLRMAARRPLLAGWWKTSSVIVGEWQQFCLLALSAVCQALLIVGVIWTVYGFQPTIFREPSTGEDRLFGEHSVDSLSRGSMLGSAVRRANAWRLLPEPFLFGFAYAVRSTEARASFLNGEFSDTGFRWFFPMALALKTPLPTLAMVAAAAATPIAIWRRGSRPARRRVRRTLYRSAPLLVFFVIYWWIALRSNLNIGHRHILPTYPVMFILCGVVATWFGSRRWWLRSIPVVAIAWLAGESLAIYPHYLAYFNELAGGPRHGYRRLVDSSLDWGQDLPGLKRWIDERRAEGRDEPIYLSYFGTGSPQAYGVDAILLPMSPEHRPPHWYELKPGVYCISASMLQGVYVDPRGPWTEKSEKIYQQLRAEMSASTTDPAGLEYFDSLRLARLCAYLRQREPDDTIGYSILIYELSADDLEQALRQPLSPADASASHTR